MLRVWACLARVETAVLNSLPHLSDLKDLSQQRSREVRTAPLSEAQQQLWLLSQISAGGSIAYNDAQVLDLQGAFDIGAAKRPAP